MAIFLILTDYRSHPPVFWQVTFFILLDMPYFVPFAKTSFASIHMARSLYVMQ